jgi:hypothetical protein
MWRASQNLSRLQQPNVLAFSPNERRYPGSLGLDTTIIRNQRDQSMRRIQILSCAVLIPMLSDQYLCAQSRIPMDMIVHG